MPATREYLQKAELAKSLLRLNPNLSEQELSDGSGISVSSARRLKKAYESGMEFSPGEEQENGENYVEQNTNALPLDFEESGAPIADEPEQGDIVSRGAKRLRALLGMTESNEEKKPKEKQPVQARLNKRQQEFVSNFAPVIAAGFTVASAWVWGRLGPEYTELAANDETAQRIMEPLVRIYARHSTFVASMTPDQIDIGQALFALMAYIHTSFSLYQKIKVEKEAQNAEPDYRDYTSGYTPEQQNGNHHSTSRSNVVSGNHAQDDGYAGKNGRDTGSLNSSLTPIQASQYAALSRLSTLDYEHRARRSNTIR